MKYDFMFSENFTDRMDVVCPRCGRHAVITVSTGEDKKIRFVCEGCGLTKDKQRDGKIFFENKPNYDEGATDWYYDLPLWYQMELDKGFLVAFNMRHLNFLEDYISDKLRERQEGEGGWSNRSIQSRMPKWILDAKNRKFIVKKIEKLKKK